MRNTDKTTKPKAARKRRVRLACSLAALGFLAAPAMAGLDAPDVLHLPAVLTAEQWCGIALALIGFGMIKRRLDMRHLQAGHDGVRIVIVSEAEFASLQASSMAAAAQRWANRSSSRPDTEWRQ